MFCYNTHLYVHNFREIVLSRCLKFVIMALFVLFLRCIYVGQTLYILIKDVYVFYICYARRIKLIFEIEHCACRIYESMKYKQKSISIKKDWTVLART